MLLGAACPLRHPCPTLAHSQAGSCPWPPCFRVLGRLSAVCPSCKLLPRHMPRSNPRCCGHHAHWQLPTRRSSFSSMAVCPAPLKPLHCQLMGLHTPHVPKDSTPGLMKLCSQKWSPRPGPRWPSAYRYLHRINTGAGVMRQAVGAGSSLAVSLVIQLKC